MSILLQRSDSPIVEITYFLPDHRKSGGRYCPVAGTIKKVDDIGGKIVLTNGTAIPLDVVADMRSEVFDPDEEQ